MSELVEEPSRIEIRGAEGTTLKQLIPEDALTYFNLIKYRSDHLRQYGDRTADKYPTVDAVRQSIEEPKPNRWRFGIWVGDTMVGSINLDTGEDSTCPEVGYWIGAEYTGHGYASRGLRTIIPFAFELPGAERLFAQVHRDNIASRKTLEKCGFTLADDKDLWVEYDLPRPETLEQ